MLPRVSPVLPTDTECRTPYNTGCVFVGAVFACVRDMEVKLSLTDYRFALLLEPHLAWCLSLFLCLFLVWRGIFLARGIAVARAQPSLESNPPAGSDVTSIWTRESRLHGQAGGGKKGR